MEFFKVLIMISVILLLGWIISDLTFPSKKMVVLISSHAEKLIDSINNGFYQKEVLINHSELYYGENEIIDCEEFKQFLTTGILDKFDDRNGY